MLVLIAVGLFIRVLIVFSTRICIMVLVLPFVLLPLMLLLRFLVFVILLRVSVSLLLILLLFVLLLLLFGLLLFLPLLNIRRPFFLVSDPIFGSIQYKAPSKWSILRVFEMIVLVKSQSTPKDGLYHRGQILLVARPDLGNWSMFPFWRHFLDLENAPEQSRLHHHSFHLVSVSDRVGDPACSCNRLDVGDQHPTRARS